MGGRFGLVSATVISVSMLVGTGRADPATGRGDRSEAKAGPPSGAGDPAASATELDLFKLEAELNETVVTASGGRSEEKSLAAAEVETVTRDEIRIHGWRSLAEVLANVPGLYVIDDLVQTHRVEAPAGEELAGRFDQSFAG